MAKQGYVYILINPSIEGLVKVGQTGKNPEDRAKELSQSTGVPTKFIVAYKEQFDDCELAESMIHTLLEEDGYRVNQNREFFEAEISDIIKKINIVKEYLLSNTEIEFIDDDIEFSDTDDLFDDLEELSPVAQSNPWDELEKIAEDALYGNNDELEDYNKAMKYYIKAYKLGSPTAPKSIGQMYEEGQSVKENKVTAIKYYKEGIARNDDICWVKLGQLYAVTNPQNTLKCFKKYLNSDGFQKHIKNENYIIVSGGGIYIILILIHMLYKANAITINEFNDIFQIILQYKEILLSGLISILNKHETGEVILDEVTVQITKESISILEKYE